MELTIRRAEERDIPRITELLYQVHDVHAQKRPDLFKVGAKKYTEPELREILADDERPVFVAANAEDGVVMGYAFCVFQHHTGQNTPSFTTLYIDDLCVHESARGQHIGKSLYEYVLSFAREKSCHNVTLNVWSCNESAMGFYKSLGMSVQKLGMEQLL